MTGGCGRRGSWSAMTVTGALCRDEGEGPLLTGLNIVYSFCLRGIGCGDSSRKRVDRRWPSGKGRRQRSQAATASPSHQVRFSFLRHFTAVILSYRCGSVGKGAFYPRVQRTFAKRPRQRQGCGRRRRHPRHVRSCRGRRGASAVTVAIFTRFYLTILKRFEDTDVVSRGSFSRTTLSKTFVGIAWPYLRASSTRDPATTLTGGPEPKQSPKHGRLDRRANSELLPQPPPRCRANKVCFPPPRDQHYSSFAS